MSERKYCSFYESKTAKDKLYKIKAKKNLNKNPTAENRNNSKKQRNKCVSIRKKAMRSQFKKATKKGAISNKEFWDLLKPFLSNKGWLGNSDISLVQNDIVITNDQEVTEIFNDHYANLIEKASG